MLAHFYMGLSELVMRGSKEKKNGKKEWLGPLKNLERTWNQYPPQMMKFDRLTWERKATLAQSS